MKKLLVSLLILCHLPLVAWFERDQATHSAQQKQWENARGTLETLIADDPNNPDLLYDLGVASYQTGNIKEAAACFERAAHYTLPNHSRQEELFYNLAHTQAEQGGIREATTRALTDEEIHSLEQAVESYERLLKLNTQHEKGSHDLPIVRTILEQQKQQQKEQKEQEHNQQQPPCDKNQDKNESKDRQDQSGSSQDRQENKQDKDQRQDNRKDQASNDQGGQDGKRDNQRDDQRNKGSEQTGNDGDNSRQGGDQQANQNRNQPQDGNQSDTGSKSDNREQTEGSQEGRDQQGDTGDNEQPHNETPENQRQNESNANNDNAADTEKQEHADQGDQQQQEHQGQGDQQVTDKTQGNENSEQHQDIRQHSQSSQNSSESLTQAPEAQARENGTKGQGVRQKMNAANMALAQETDKQPDKKMPQRVAMLLKQCDEADKEAQKRLIKGAVGNLKGHDGQNCW